MTEKKSTTDNIKLPELDPDSPELDQVRGGATRITAIADKTKITLGTDLAKTSKVVASGGGNDI